LQDPATFIAEQMISFHNFINFNIIYIGIAVCFFLAVIIYNLNNKKMKSADIKSYTNFSILEIIGTLISMLLFLIVFFSEEVFFMQKKEDFYSSKYQTFYNEKEVVNPFPTGIYTANIKKNLTTPLILAVSPLQDDKTPCYQKMCIYICDYFAYFFYGKPILRYETKNEFVKRLLETNTFAKPKARTLKELRDTGFRVQNR